MRDELDALKARNAANQAEKDRLERELRDAMEISITLNRDKSEKERLLHASKKRKEAIQGQHHLTFCLC